MHSTEEEESLWRRHITERALIPAHMGAGGSPPISQILRTPKVTDNRVQLLDTWVYIAIFVSELAPYKPGIVICSGGACAV